MHASEGGRWVPTFASDIEPGDRIRRDGAERHVVGRTWPPAYTPTFELTCDGGSETIAKTAIVAIWDPDGSVAARVVSRSAEAAVLAGGSGSGGLAGGFVEPTR